jgi:hypothetical protein
MEAKFALHRPKSRYIPEALANNAVQAIAEDSNHSDFGSARLMAFLYWIAKQVLIPIISGAKRCPYAQS